MSEYNDCERIGCQWVVHDQRLQVGQGELSHKQGAHEVEGQEGALFPEENP